MSNKVPDAFEVARLFLEDARSVVDPTVFAKLHGAIRAKHWQQVLHVTDDYRLSSNTIDQFNFCSQMSALFKKNTDFEDKAICTDAARSSFERAERLCRITNRRLDWFYRHPERMPDDLRAKILVAERFISNVLGDTGDFLRRIPESIKITSGATSDQPREKSRPYMKIRKTYACTPRCEPYVRSLVKFHTGGEPKIVHNQASRVTLVPKTSLTYRTIACEPIGNLPFQLAVDRHLKENLKRISGIDLRDQTTNQKMARIGSLDGSLCTIDLTMASDTLSYNTVAMLLPSDWLRLLDDLRTPCYKGCFGTGRFSKYSSMGNGFTFSLETLIFASFCEAVGSKTYSVYGDDIILESSLYDEIVALLRWFGFVPNLQKSFSTGPFRESCGKDYYHGVDIRPFYLKGSPGNAYDMCHFINGIVGVALPEGKLWSRMKRLVKTERLHIVPFNENSGSGIFVHPHDAYKMGVIRAVGWINRFRGYVCHSKPAYHYGIQSYLLWHLRAYGRTDREQETHCDVFAIQRLRRNLPIPRCDIVGRRINAESDAVTTSEGQSAAIKVRTRQLVWHLPACSVPSHLYIWADFLNAV